MRFLAPLALIGLVLLALPVAIHLLVRRRARKLDFPSLKFLRETPSFRLRPRRVQQPLLLLLRLAAIALIVLALARPIIYFYSSSGRIRIIMIDASLSMQAQGSAEAAREQARSLIEGLAAGERATIITFSANANPLLPVTSNKVELLAAVDRYQPASGPANYAVALRLADGLLEKEPPGEVLINIISDFQQSAFTRDQVLHLEQIPRRAQIVPHAVGGRVMRNAFLMDETVAAGETGIALSASEIVITAEGREGARKNWIIDSPEGARPGIEWRTETNGQIIARIQTLAADDFDADDNRFLAFVPPRQPRVLLIEPTGDDAAPYLRAALEATARDLPDGHAVIDQKSALPETNAELDRYGLITVTLNDKPSPAAMHVLADFARAGGTVLLCMGREVDTASWNEFAKGADAPGYPFSAVARKETDSHPLSFGVADGAAPALRFVGDQFLTALRAVRMQSGYAVVPREESFVLMRWNDGSAALVEANTGSGTIILLGTSPARAAGDLGISPAFPALVSSIMRSSLVGRAPLMWSIGAPVSLREGPQSDVKITDPNGRTAVARARDLILSPTAFFKEPGVYGTETGGETRFLAFNAPPAESETALAAVEEITRIFSQQKPATATSVWREAFERQANTWRYLLAASLILLIAELFVLMRQRQIKTMSADQQDEG